MNVHTILLVTISNEGMLCCIGMNQFSMQQGTIQALTMASVDRPNEGEVCGIDCWEG